MKKKDMQQTHTSLFINQPHPIQSISHISVTSQIFTHLQNHNGGTKKWILFEYSGSDLLFIIVSRLTLHSVPM